MNQKKKLLLPLLLMLAMLFCGCSELDQLTSGSGVSFDLDSIPEFSGSPYVVINDNVPDFKDKDYGFYSYEDYGPLDLLGRCTSCIANIGEELMPTEPRGSISGVKPTGWQLVKYDFVDGKYLYNRCHLIGFQLTGENANERNLITGTRYMNTEGMLPFKNKVANYIEKTGNHVLYRVTPIFEGSNLLASGVQMEAMSVEDNGEGILFNVYVYNCQPGVVIDYATGDNHLDKSWEEDDSSSNDGGNTKATYILNTSSGKFHLPSCSGVKTMHEENKQEYTGKRDKLISSGYEPCGNCHP